MQIDRQFFRPAEVDLLIGDPAKAREKLGWEPKVTFTELVHMMVDADVTARKVLAASNREHSHDRAFITGISSVAPVVRRAVATGTVSGLAAATLRLQAAWEETDAAGRCDSPAGVVGGDHGNPAVGTHPGCPRTDG